MIQLSSRELDHCIMGVYAVNSTTGKVIMERCSELSLIPSSCLKIATTGAALHILGEDLRFETTLEYDGFIREKILYGNLYIRGGGDPCLGSPSWEKQLEVFVDAITALGISSIQGRVIGDDSRWERALAPPSWLFEDLGNYYGVGASALSFHENRYSLFFKPGKNIGDPTVVLRTDPPLPHLVLQNEVTTGAFDSGDQACIYGSEFSFVQHVRGTIPKGVDEFFIRGAIPDPPLVLSELLGDALKARGVAIEGQPIEATSRTSFHTTFSPTIREIVYWTNQKSVNLYAEHLLKKMGEAIHHEGSTASGIKAVTNFWRSQGIDLSGCNIADGSGLSRKNYITAKELVSMLLVMKQSDFFPAFLESLPLKSDHVKMKTGTMSFIRGYVGYVNNVAFAILVNQCSNPKLVKEKVDLLILQFRDCQEI